MDPGRIQVVDDFIQQNGIHSRSSWGARNSKIPDKPESYDWDYEVVVIHHSGMSGDTSPTSVQSKHLDRNGWDDVGYHFMVGPGGQVYEGRRLFYKGSHTEGANTGKVGILVMGNFEKAWLGLFGGTPAPLQVQAAKTLVRALKALFPTLRKLGGHKDFKVRTECPGNELYALLGDIRTSTGMIGPP